MVSSKDHQEKGERQKQKKPPSQFLLPQSNPLLPPPMNSPKTLSNPLKIPKQSNMPTLTLHQSILNNPISRWQHSSRSKTNTIPSRKRKIIIRINLLDTLTRDNPRTIHSRQRLPIQHCRRRVSVLGMVRRPERKVLLEPLGFCQRALQILPRRGERDSARRGYFVGCSAAARVCAWSD